MEQQKPPAPPEAEVIRLARQAARMSPAKAAESVRSAGGQISDGYWRDIERGYGGRRGITVPVRASEELLAQMAYAVGVTADELDEAGRADAAAVLRAIHHRRTLPPGPVLPAALALAREAGINPDNPDDPWLQPVRAEIARAIVRYGPDARPDQVFDDPSDIVLWAAADLTASTREIMIAATRKYAASYRERHGNSPARRIGLVPAAAFRANLASR